MNKTTSHNRVRQLVTAAVIAAVYCVVALALAPLSFGQIQVRVAEALTILPVLIPAAVPGLALGCVLTNAVGVAMGVNPLGMLDVAVGGVATLTAAFLTRALRGVRWRGVPAAATLPPVVVNAAAVGAELCFMTTGRFSLAVFAPLAGFVALGQFLSCTVLGLVLWGALERTNTQKKNRINR